MLATLNFGDSVRPQVTDSVMRVAAGRQFIEPPGSILISEDLLSSVDRAQRKWGAGLVNRCNGSQCAVTFLNTFAGTTGKKILL